MTNIKRSASVLALVAALGLTACGGADEPAAKPASSTTAVAETPKPAPAKTSLEVSETGIIKLSEMSNLPKLPTLDSTKTNYVDDAMRADYDMSPTNWVHTCAGEDRADIDSANRKAGSTYFSLYNSSKSEKCTPFYVASAMDESFEPNTFLLVYSGDKLVESQLLGEQFEHETQLWPLEEGSSLLFMLVQKDNPEPTMAFKVTAGKAEFAGKSAVSVD